MPFFQQETLTVTTAAGGGATATTVNTFNGFLQCINYVIDGTNPYANSVVITVTGEKSGLNLWTQTLATNASQVNYPSAPLTTQAGVAVGGTTAVGRIPLINERIQVVISAGGASKLGAFTFIVGG